MNKIVIIAMGICTAAFVSSCKSNESMYKKAYEKAQAQTQVAAQAQPPVQVVQAPAPVKVAPVTTTTTSTADNSNVGVRSEQVTLISGSGIKTYSVVCGSFGLRANADALQNTLKSKGYNAQIVQQSTGKKLYRVVAATSDQKSEVVQKLTTLRATYADAWVLSPRDY